MAFSSDLAQNWEPIVSGNVDSPRTPHNLVGPEHKGFDVVQHAFAPQGGGRIEDAARHRRPSRFLGVGCTEEGAVDRRRLGFWRVFGKPNRQFLFLEIQQSLFCRNKTVTGTIKSDPRRRLRQKGVILMTFMSV